MKKNDIIHEENVKEFKEKVNNFLKNDRIVVHDIKYSTSNYTMLINNNNRVITVYSAMIIYDSYFK